MTVADCGELRDGHWVRDAISGWGWPSKVSGAWIRKCWLQGKLCTGKDCHTKKTNKWPIRRKWPMFGLLDELTDAAASDVT